MDTAYEAERSTVMEIEKKQKHYSEFCALW